jgi:hypothetical protein
MDRVRQNSFIEVRGSCVLSGEGREEERSRVSWHVFFYITLNLEVGRHYIIVWPFSPVGLGEEPLSKRGISPRLFLIQPASKLHFYLFG